jgi:hypothetical protein
VAGLLLALAGCAAVPERTPLPADLTGRAVIPGVPEARFWGDEWPRLSAERLERLTPADARASYPALFGKPHNYLAISGGGANGAFGAGLLAGWSATTTT